MNWTGTKNDITRAIRSIGFPVKISLATGGNISCYGVWSSSEAKDYSETFPSHAQHVLKTMYVEAKAKVPKVGDVVVASRESYGIKEVVEYKPQDLVLAYKLIVEA
jgi:hypothetical protein